MHRGAFVLLLLISGAPALALRINEVMYNPQGDDNGQEFIELFTENVSDLSGFSVADSASNDTLERMRAGSDGNKYALVVEDNADLSLLGIAPDAAVYTIGTTIGNGLSNAGDRVAVYASSGTLLDEFFYDGTLANGHGPSLVLANGEWQESAELGGSPGRENAAKQLTGDGDCAIPFSLSADRLEYHGGDTVRIQLSLGDETTPFTLVYWVEDAEGNIIRAKRNTTNANAKSFTAVAGAGDAELILMADYSPSCAPTPTHAEHRITVLGDGRVRNSTLRISRAPTTAQFGDRISIAVEAYRGSTRKSSVAVSVVNAAGEKVSSTAKFSVAEQFATVTGEIELELSDHCSHPTGMYALVAEGLNASARIPLTISARNCTETAGAVVRQQLLTLSFMEFPTEAEPRETHLSTLVVSNPNSGSRTADIWSYAYRGSKSLSGEREANRQTVQLVPGENEIPLEVVLDDTEPGIAWYKVRLLLEGRKTPQELRQNFTVLAVGGPDVEPHSPASAALPSAVSPHAAADLPRQHAPELSSESEVTYYAKSARIKRLTLYALLGACFVVISLLVWRGE